MEGSDGSHGSQELRVALVMTGGVSLCVWMGGVARELDRLLRRESAYGVVLDALNTEPRLDVVAGTSAGGLNGALLATARVFGSDVSDLRDLWLKTGSLDELLQTPDVGDPASVLRGDYFHEEVREALGELATGVVTQTEPLELLITGTLLHGRPTGKPDDFGTVIRDADHHAQFRFRLADFERDGVLDQLALAARCTASFPGAFAPCFVPIGYSGRPGPANVDMEGIANFPESRWVVDGGVLLNKPINPALKAIFAMPAETQVRRVMLYVIPEAAPEPRDDELEEEPRFVSTLLAGAVTIPTNQSISAELDALLEHNARADATRERRGLAAGLGGGNVEVLAADIYADYRAVVADIIAGWIMRLVADGAAGLYGDSPDSPLWDAARLRDALADHLSQLPPAEFPPADTPADAARWFTTYDTVVRAGAVVIDVLRVALGLARTGSDDLRMRIAGVRGQVHEVLEATRQRRDAQAPTPARRQQLSRDALDALARAELAAWAGTAVGELFGTPEDWLGDVRALAGLLPPAVALLDEALHEATERQAAAYRRADRLVAGLRCEGHDAALRRLLALEVVELALGDQPPVLDQKVELVQVSADGPNGLDDPRTRPEEKLTGLQLSHFGAFYKTSWRANDWLWGRVDAATRLTQMLLEPFRLRQLEFTREAALELVRRAALGEAPPEELSRSFDEAALDQELGFLPDAAGRVREERLPRSLPKCALAIARRIQLEAAQEELPTLARTVREDPEEPAREPWASTPTEGMLEPAAAIQLFHANDVGGQRIKDDVGSRRFERTTYRTASVLLAVLTGSASGLPGGQVGRLVLAPLATAARLAVRGVLALRRR